MNLIIHNDAIQQSQSKDSPGKLEIHLDKEDADQVQNHEMAAV